MSPYTRFYFIFTSTVYKKVYSDKRRAIFTSFSSLIKCWCKVYFKTGVTEDFYHNTIVNSNGSSFPSVYCFSVRIRENAVSVSLSGGFTVEYLVVDHSGVQIN
jgi:hypothetical protein